MTEIEQKALALAIEVREDAKMRLCPDPTLLFGNWEALCRAIEQHEAFKQEVSDVMTYIKALYPTLPRNFNRFIIPKPKPDALAEAPESTGVYDAEVKDLSEEIRAAAKHLAEEIRVGLEVLGVEIGKKWH